MNSEVISLKNPSGGVLTGVLESCPDCAGPICARGDGKGGVEEYCEMCGATVEQLLGPPGPYKENNPLPPEEDAIGEAPFPRDMIAHKRFLEGSHQGKPEKKK